MFTIEIDFQLYRELTYLRQSEEESYADVIRKLLKLPPSPKTAATNPLAKPWISEGVTFPSGTQFRGTRKGKTYTAEVDDGQLIAGGNPCAGLSPAVKAVTGKGENGWRFWEVKRPADPDFIPVDQLRKKK
jgi:hypothetical protein